MPNDALRSLFPESSLKKDPKSSFADIRQNFLSCNKRYVLISMVCILQVKYNLFLSKARE